MHMSELPSVSNPSTMYKKGEKIECRILSVNANTKRVFLTRKKSFLNPEHPVIVDYEHLDKCMLFDRNMMD